LAARTRSDGKARLFDCDAFEDVGERRPVRFDQARRLGVDGLDERRGIRAVFLDDGTLLWLELCPEDTLVQRRRGGDIDRQRGDL
jgi:hypothetical protein